MKKIIHSIFIFASLFIAGNLIAQPCGNSGPSACSASGLLLNGGFENPDTTDCAVQGIAYNYPIQFKMFTVFNYPPGSTQSVDSIEFVAIDNLPCGLCWAINDADRRYSADEDGCLNIKGTTNDPAGQYKLGLTLKAWINGASTFITVPSTLADQAGVKIFLRVITPTGVCTHVDTSAGAANLTATTGCPLGIEDFNGNFFSMSLVPNPMNMSGVVSFVSSKMGSYTLRISDITGKVVSSREIEGRTGANTVAIDRNKLSAGVYFLSLTDGKNTTTKRFTLTD